MLALGRPRLLKIAGPVRPNLSPVPGTLEIHRAIAVQGRDRLPADRQTRIGAVAWTPPEPSCAGPWPSRKKTYPTGSGTRPGRDHGRGPATLWRDPLLPLPV